MKLKCLSFILLILAGCNMSDMKTGKLLSYHFDTPARIWEESFPLGNGRLGLMPDGGVDTEKIVLNDISMWSVSKIRIILRHIIRWVLSVNSFLKGVTMRLRN